MAVTKMTNKDMDCKGTELEEVENIGFTELVDHAVDESNLPRYDDKEITRLLRKVDWRLLPILTFLYLVSFVDRGNMGNAKVAGMNKSLHLTSGQFNLALTVRKVYINHLVN